MYLSEGRKEEETGRPGGGEEERREGRGRRRRREGRGEEQQGETNRRFGFEVREYVELNIEKRMKKREIL